MVHNFFVIVNRLDVISSRSVVINYSKSLQLDTIHSIHGGRVAIKHSPATLEVTGSHPTCGGISEIYFSNRYSLRHGGFLNGLCGVAGINYAL